MTSRAERLGFWLSGSLKLVHLNDGGINATLSVFVVHDLQNKLCLLLLLQELEDDGVDASLVLRAEGFPSPFTYTIVDQSGACFGGQKPFANLRGT